MKVSAISNGILIRKKLSAIKKLDDFNITLDAYDEQSFAKNRGGTAKQWESIMAGLQQLRKDNIQFTLSFLATSKNIEELFQLIELANTYQPTTLRLNSFNPHSDTRDLVLTKSDPRVMQVITEIMKRTDYSYNIKLPFVFDDQHTYFSNKICVYPWHGAYINEKCDMSYCCHLAHEPHIGNICNDDTLKICLSKIACRLCLAPSEGKKKCFELLRSTVEYQGVTFRLHLEEDAWYFCSACLFPPLGCIGRKLWQVQCTATQMATRCSKDSSWASLTEFWDSVPRVL